MRRLISFLSLFVLLCSCEINLPISSSSLSSTESTSTTSSAISSKAEVTDGVYDFYCVNDFHGSIMEQYNGGYYESGIAKCFGKLKELKAADPEHTVILSAGDMFQGSLESNDNFGHLVTEAMNEAGFDAMTLGNHEFDYGQEKLLDLVELADFPFLAGNIMRYEDGHTTDTPWNDDVPCSTILERGGNKIGIVGMIGEGQTTSICSKYVQNVDFVEPDELAAIEAQRLRNEEGCSLVVYVKHADESSLFSYTIEGGFFDGIFTGHSHTSNLSLYEGIPIIQSYSNGSALSHFQITIQDGGASCTSYEHVYAQESWQEDPEIAAIRDRYVLDSEFATKASAVAGTINGTLAAKEGVPNLAAKAMYERFIDEHPTIDCAMENGQRAPLSGTITYRDITKAAPFMNKIVIAKVLGSEIQNEARYNACYRGSRTAKFLPNVTYTIACVDYVLYHQSVQKRFDYFPSLNESFESKIIAEYEIYPYDLIFDYIHDTLGGTVNPDDFTSYSPGFGI